MEKNKDTGIIRRVRKEKAFAQISNELINNEQLSYKALGILTYILSKPDDWEVYNSDLIREGIDGKESIRTGLLELKEKKYIQRYRVFNKKTGSVHHWETLVSETPFDDDELISSVKETYAYDNEGKIIYKKVVLGSFERYVPIVINREVILLSENQKVEKKHKKNPTIQKPKSRNPKTRKTDPTNTNITNTESLTNTKSSSSSKGNATYSIHPLVDLFNNSICELKKTTTVKFMKYVETYDKEFIEAMIAYCEERNAKSYSYFAKAIERYICEGITTVEDMNRSIENFKSKNKTKKKNSLKDKDDIQNLNSAIEAAKTRELDEVLNKGEHISSGVEVEEVKEFIKGYVSDSVFKAWIAPNRFLDVNGRIVMVCVNMFTKDVIERRYYNEISTALKESGFNSSLVLDVIY